MDLSELKSVLMAPQSFVVWKIRKFKEIYKKKHRQKNVGNEIPAAGAKVFGVSGRQPHYRGAERAPARTDSAHAQREPRSRAEQLHDVLDGRRAPHGRQMAGQGSRFARIPHGAPSTISTSFNHASA